MRFLKFLLRLYQAPFLWLSKQCFCLADRMEKWAAEDGLYVPQKRRQNQALPQAQSANSLSPTVDAEGLRRLRHIEDMEKTKKYWLSAVGWGLLAWWGLSK